MQIPHTLLFIDYPEPCLLAVAGMLPLQHAGNRNLNSKCTSNKSLHKATSINAKSFIVLVNLHAGIHTD